MLPIPRHLLKIFQVDPVRSNEHNLEGSICCSCGSKCFEIIIFADLDKNNFPHVGKYEGDYALLIKAICKDCKREWLLFDMSKHGYDGYVCHDGITVPDSGLMQYACAECKGRYFEIIMGLEVEDKEQFIEEVVEEEPDHFSEEDYVDAFNWITIDIKCLCCEKWMKGWLDFETA